MTLETVLMIRGSVRAAILVVVSRSPDLAVGKKKIEITLRTGSGEHI